MVLGYAFNGRIVARGSQCFYIYFLSYFKNELFSKKQSIRIKTCLTSVIFSNAYWFLELRCLPRIRFDFVITNATPIISKSALTCTKIGR